MAGHKRELAFGSLLAVAIVIVLATAVVAAESASRTSSSISVFNGQTYSGVMEGGALYENNSFPFQSYAPTSRILALPAVSSWLNPNGYSPSDLRPYLTMYPSQGNPYDFAQGNVVVNGTTYNVYEYIVTNSTVGLVIGVWVAANSSQTVGKIFTYDTVGPGVAQG